MYTQTQEVVNVTEADLAATLNILAAGFGAGKTQVAEELEELLCWNEWLAAREVDLIQSERSE